MIPLPIKFIGETISVEFNFTGLMEFGDTLSSASTSVTVFSGLDPAPSSVISGTPTVGATTVIQSFTAGLPGVIYILTVTGVTASGDSIQVSKKLAVLSAESGFRPGENLTLSGDLPDTYKTVNYSESLVISEGFPPYEFDDIVSGTPPPWMSFNISGNLLVCAGLVTTATTTTFTFNPRVRDTANNLADDPQVLTVKVITIAGDVPDGFVGDSISGSYNATDAYGTVTYSVTAGTFPAGLTLNSDGTYSGTLTTANLYSWTVTGVDSLGNTAHVDDTCLVKNVTWLASRTSTTPGIGKADNATNWTSYALSGNIIGRFIADGSNVLLYSDTFSELSTDGGATWSSAVAMIGIQPKWQGIFFNGNFYVPSRQDGLLVSATGLGGWTAITPDIFDYSVAGGTSLMVRGGGAGKISYSTDGGSTWSAPVTVFSGGANCYGLASDGALFVVGNAGDSTGSAAPRMAYSSSGSSWTLITNPFTAICASGDEGVKIAYGNGLWVAGLDASSSGPLGQFAYSTDGMSWTLAADTLGAGVWQIYYSNGLFVAVGHSGKIATSTNGNTWTQQANNFGGVDLKSVVAVPV